MSNSQFIFYLLKVNVACLPKENSTYSSILPDRNVVAIGWGSTSSSFDHEFPDRLQQTSFRIQDSEGIFEPFYYFCKMSYV